MEKSVFAGASDAADIHEGLSDQESSGAVDHMDPFQDGDNKYAKFPIQKITDACGSKNALCCQFMYLDSKHHDGICSDLIICGGADAIIRGYDCYNGQLIFTMKAGGPILAISCADTCLATACMDGSIIVVYILYL